MGCCCPKPRKIPRHASRRASRSNQLVHHIQEIEAFRQLPAGDESLSIKHAVKKRNSALNRYRDVLPYDKNRVILKHAPHDYINASYIESDYQDYIATQGPLKSTIADFWDMMWQENSRVIVMLSPLIEMGRHRCARYWPEEEERGWEIADYKITCLTSETRRFWEERTFYFEKLPNESDDEQSEKSEKEEGRVISHFLMPSWPDLDIPEPCSPDQFVKFVKIVRKRQLENFGDAIEPAIVIHCSAGIGRSGVYILIDQLLWSIEHGEDVLPIEVLWKMRKQRALMVETEVQFAWALKCINYTGQQ